jgi:hypothetical protein
MLGLRFFVCEECETAYADIEVPECCHDCGAPALEELAGGSQAAEYFAPSDTRGR